MALQKNIKIKDNLGFDIEFNDTYIKIARVECTKQENSFLIEFKKDSNSDPYQLQYINSSYDINGENPIKQAYLHLKTLPEFAGAVDC
jgi:hypothetical protein